MAKMPHGWYLLCGGDPEFIGNFTMYLSLLDEPAWLLNRILTEEAAVENAMHWYADQLMQQAAMRHFQRIQMP